MATVSRAPTSDVSITGSWTGTASSRWTLIDDFPSQDSADQLTHGTTAGVGLFGFTAFAVPTGSTAISVMVRLYAYKNGGGGNSFSPRIRSGATTADGAAISTLGNGIATIALFEQSFANDPATGAAWTVSGVNSGLNAFGIVATDANPSISITSMEVQVTYTEPVPVISDVSTDEVFTNGDTGVPITLTNGGASQGTGLVELASGSDYATATKVSQTVTSWADTAIQFTAGLGGLTAGSLFLFVTNDAGGRSTGFAVTVNQPSRALVSWIVLKVPSLAGEGEIVNQMAQERSIFRRLNGRVFSRMN